MKKFIYCCILIASLNPAYSQVIKIRQSFQSEDTKPEPAIATYTKPKKGDESFLIDGAVGLSWGLSDRKTLSGFFEYHKNTLVDELSNTRQLGISFEWLTNSKYNVQEIGKQMTRKENGRRSAFTTNLKYSNNKIKGIESIQITEEWTLFLLDTFYKGWLIPNHFNKLGSQLGIEYFPSLGLEYEGRYKTDNETTKGNILRGMAKIYISIYPLSSLLKNKVELFSRLHYRHDVINSTADTDKSHPSIEAGFNYIISREPRFAIGASYNNIDNPALGQEKQNFWLVALKVKI